jgi:hypothetical protein
MNYSDDHRLNFRKQHIENERKPVPSNVAGTKLHTTTTPKIEGTKGNEVKVSNSTRKESGSSSNNIATPVKGSKRN